MKKWKLFMLSSMLLISVCLSNALVFTNNGQSPELENVFPQHTLAYFTVGDTDSLRDDFKGTSLWDLGQEAEVKEFLAEVDSYLSLLSNQVPQKELLKAKELLTTFSQDLLASVHGQVAFGVFYDANLPNEAQEPPHIQMALVINVGSETDAFFNKFTAFMEKIAVMNGMPPSDTPETSFVNTMFQQSDHNGSTVYSIDNDPSTVSFAKHKDSILFGLGFESDSPVKSMMDRMDASPATSLATNTRFQAARTKLHLPKSSILAFIDTEAILQRYQARMPKEAKTILTALGINSVKSVSTALFMNGKTIGHRSFLNLKEHRPGILKLMAPTPAEFKSLSFVPADSLTYLAFHQDTEQYLAEIKTAIQQINPEAIGQLDNALMMAKSIGSIDLQEDVLANLGGEMGMFVTGLKPGMVGAMPKIYLFAEVKDQAKLDRVLATAITFGAMQSKGKVNVKHHKYMDQDYATLGVALFPVFFDFNPSWTYHNGFLFVSLNANDMKQLIKQFKTGYAPISENIQLQTALKGMPTENRISITFNDFPRQYPNVHGQILAFMSMGQGLMGMSDLMPGYRRSRPRMSMPPFDMATFPMEETITKHLYPVAGVSTVDQDGIYSEMNAMSISAPASIAVVAIVAAIAIPNLLESKKLTNERAAFPTIKSIGTAQALFREMEELDADADGFGEYAQTFAHLAGTGTATGVQILGMVPIAADTTQSEKNGYYFKLFTPTVDNAGTVDDDETAWAVVAWPKKWGKTGTKVYFMAEDNIAYEYNNLYGMFDGLDAQPTIADCYGTPFDNSTVMTGAAGFLLKK